jgi:hypothetical protein
MTRSPGILHLRKERWQPKNALAYYVSNLSLNDQRDVVDAEKKLSTICKPACHKTKRADANATKLGLRVKYTFE